MLKQKHGLGYLWSEKACFFMSKQVGAYGRTPLQLALNSPDL